MDRRASTDTVTDPDEVYAVVSDLGRYPEWVEVVTKVESVDPIGEENGAWLVTLRAQVGPFARSKRLRMVRTRHEPPATVRFERAELDGRNHAAWVLDATVEPISGGSRVTMELSYDGNLWSGVLDRVLGSMIDDAVEDLRQLVER